MRHRGCWRCSVSNGEACSGLPGCCSACRYIGCCCRSQPGGRSISSRLIHTAGKKPSMGWQRHRAWPRWRRALNQAWPQRRLIRLLLYPELIHPGECIRVFRLEFMPELKISKRGVLRKFLAIVSEQSGIEFEAEKL